MAALEGSSSSEDGVSQVVVTVKPAFSGGVDVRGGGVESSPRSRSGNGLLLNVVDVVSLLWRTLRGIELETGGGIVRRLLGSRRRERGRFSSTSSEKRMNSSLSEGSRSWYWEVRLRRLEESIETKIMPSWILFNLH